MKVPAIRSKIGVWVYYVSTLSFEQVSSHVKKVDDELHKSTLLREMLQRSITDNYKSIATYINQQEERFFNALVLAVYDGDPQWHEVSLEYDNGDEFFDLGILELSGNEKIFPVDGQHRVEGIKKAIADNPELCTEKIPVIFIGHKKDDEGMQRARRMFSTLNRYAKPVSLRDIIALDEDDSIALACRHLIDTHRMFSNGRVLDSKNKSISVRNNQFTTIITLYEANRELLADFIEPKEILSADGRALKKSSKVREYIRRRPSDEDIKAFITFTEVFWTAMVDSFPSLKAYSLDDSNNSAPYRHENGGNLLFRPLSLVAIIKASIIIKNKKNLSWEDAFGLICELPLELDTGLWRNVLWNQIERTMITNTTSTIESIILYCVDKTLLTEKEVDKLLKKLQGALTLPDQESVCAHLEEYQL